MKPLLQKLPLDEGSSFVARKYTTPLFETPWHQHEAIELVLCNGSSGSVFIGDDIGEYEKGDVFLLGKNLPHWFRKKDDRMIGKAIVIQFTEQMFGETFFGLPELKPIVNLLSEAQRGIKLTQPLSKKIKKQLKIIEKAQGFKQLNILLNCLYDISTSKSYNVLSNSHSLTFSKEDQDKIGKVYEYSIQHYKEQITLQQMADLTNQSVSNFCKYFKLNTKKTYIQFLNEIKIGEACKLLKESNLSITEVCYESGFRNWANFSSQFKKKCKLTPSEYRKKFVRA